MSDSQMKVGLDQEQASDLSRFSEQLVNERRLLTFLNEFQNQAVTPNFLLSFPRSGNGYVRVFLAKLILLEMGYPIDGLQTESYIHNPPNGTAVRYVFPERGTKISVEEILPDLYMNSARTISNLPDRFLFGNVRLIKSHHMVPLTGPDFIYLFRDPKQCCTSYFQLSGGLEHIGGMGEVAQKHVFATAVSSYLKTYTQMGQLALEAAKSQRCSPLSLKRMSAGDFSQLSNWLRRTGFSYSDENLNAVHACTPVKSGVNKTLYELWIPDLDPDLEKARQMYHALENIH